MLRAGFALGAAGLALLFAHPLTIRLGIPFESVLEFAAGIVNVAAIIAIANEFTAQKEKGKLSTVVKNVFFFEVVVLAIIIGVDTVVVIPSSPFRMVIGLGLALITLAVLFNGSQVYSLFFAALTAAFFCGLAGPALLPRLHLDTIFQTLGVSLELGPRFFHVRALPWVHLVVIPLLYLSVDYSLRASVPSCAKALKLDVPIAVTGLVTAVAGLAVVSQTSDTGQFEAGSAAVILVLGNWLYIRYVHPPQAENDNTAHPKPPSGGVPHGEEIEPAPGL